jgi:hypothetical protein
MATSGKNQRGVPWSAAIYRRFRIFLFESQIRRLATLSRLGVVDSDSKKDLKAAINRRIPNSSSPLPRLQ